MLWESEVKSRSMLGVKTMEMEREIEESCKLAVDEKRKAQRWMELKNASDAKIEIYEQRSVQHQKDVSALRTKLKQYQRRLKDYEHGEARIPALHKEFDKERESMQQNVSNLRRQDS